MHYTYRLYKKCFSEFFSMLIDLRPQSHTCPGSFLSGDTGQDAVHGCCGYHYTASSLYSTRAEMYMSMKIKPILWYCDLAKSLDCRGSISTCNISTPWSRWQSIKIACDIKGKQRTSFKGSHAEMFQICKPWIQTCHFLPWSFAS